MPNPLVSLPKDYLGGGLMILIGASAAGMGATYSIGTLRQMGPGFFPVALGVLLMFAGTAIAVAAWLERARAGVVKSETLPPEWRGWACIVGALIAFVILGRYGGLLAACAAVVFIAAMGDRDNKLKDGLLLMAIMLVFAIVVIWGALRMSFPLFTWGGA
ncbi:hypothetical protein OKW43_004927 [Paraburkholderia sp. WC7.3g]|uniref:Tripartite tricarboxylate transporter TctB family protein n=1 Tax=Paraburkholderia podalyriae TaxID=1938811 RepID=A0ABR7PHW0_9BURK|nr:tripartite tricarboxylate transporter TctB family protein [Paraburkholderia podalyriae]MBC8745954.1 tripartite tricarboxylate transporter TctB family protein [Paraburkholderia podalyriae]